MSNKSFSASSNEEVLGGGTSKHRETEKLPRVRQSLPPARCLLHERSRAVAAKEDRHTAEK